MTMRLPASWPRWRGGSWTAGGARRRSLAWQLVKLLIFTTALAAAWALAPAVAHAGPLAG